MPNPAARRGIGSRVPTDLHRMKEPMDLTHQDVRDILKIIDSAEHLNEIELAMGGFRLHVVRGAAGGASLARSGHVVAGPATAAPAHAPSPVSPAPAADPASQAVPAGIVAIRAPMLGTFYRAPAPNERPFVEVGQRVKADDTVCMIEVMKLFNSIRAGVDGTVVKICADNAAMVEFNQVLVHVKPD
ncbi:MAG: acetyl-CoA carboxylase biotin carboxyl carrier protein [Hyphomicrobiales bacterium]|nr:MAG: acetyl-CoA carboxylase biotin carboxyl carrier protein [Hyphomicrobiales bacterium]